MKIGKQLSKTRWQDTERELRIRLHKTMELQIGYNFYHEDVPSKEQIISVTTSTKNGEVLDVTLFIDKVKKLLNDK
jgi:hypothetical protein